MIFLRVVHAMLGLFAIACSPPQQHRAPANDACAERYAEISPNPREDARRLARAGDRRFIGVGGPGLSIPSLSGQRLSEVVSKGDYRVISGLSDDGTCFQFADDAYRYAAEFNREMLLITSR